MYERCPKYKRKSDVGMIVATEPNGTVEQKSKTPETKTLFPPFKKIQSYINIRNLYTVLAFPKSEHTENNHFPKFQSDFLKTIPIFL